MADYLEAFARESEEQITELNNALLEFEDDPTDEAAMDGIFRTAHTLKGNCGAMGFEPAEDLAHAMEDLLEAIRSNRVAVTPEVMDAIFDGVDELDAMISEAVEQGEVQRQADAEIETLREYADRDALAEPTDAEIDDLIESVSAPSDDEHSVYHVRLDVAGDPAVHGRAVVDALDDAFELLGTDPDGEAIDAADYDGTIDAAFASVVERAAVEAALEPVDAVSGQVIEDVTDRVETGAPDDVADDSSTTADAGSVDDADANDDVGDLSVDELLQDEDVDQFDDLDEMAEEVGDTSEFEDLGDAGSFADLGLTEDDVDVGTADGPAAGDDSAADADDVDAGADDAADSAARADDGDDEVEDAAAEFAQLKEEVDPVGFDELQDELADLEFDEYDSDDEVGFDELLDEEELEDDGAFAESTITASAAEDAAAPADDSASAAVDDADASVPEAQQAPDAAGADATAEDLFGGTADDTETDEPAVDAGDESTGDAADEPTADAVDPDVADASDDADESTAPSEAEAVPDDAEAPVDVDEAATADDAEDGAVETDDVSAESDDAAADTGTSSADDPTTVADDAGGFDASEMLDAESLEESAQSFGEGGLDLSDESDDAEESATPAGADDLDLDESLGDVASDAEASDDDAVADEAGDSLDLGEDDIDFGDGTVAGTEEPSPDETDESVAVGDALEDDSFGSDVAADADDLDADAEPAAPDETAESVENFGDEESVLDLDDGEVAGTEAPPEGDEATLDSGDTADVATSATDEPSAEFGDSAGSSGEESLADSTVEAASESTPESADDDPVPDTSDDGAGSFDDPGFSDGASSAEDDGPEVDEDRLERIRTLGVPQRGAAGDSGPSGTQSIRVDVESLDRMLNMVEGLVTSRARLRRALIENEPREVLEDELDDLEDVTSELQDTVMDVRLVPLRTAVNKLPRIVRDVAREEDKQVDFEMVGEEVELDRSILDEIGDPLVHLVRNAVDHGIETPDTREEAGKPAEGSVELRATRERDRVTIVVDDDGAGIDADAVRDAAVEEGIHTRSEVDSMDDEDVHELIFHSGFSTASEVTDVSGRGVGMDVVAETVDRLDGTVSVESEPGEGTTITMELPVTLAIAEVLFVDVGGEEYGIPIKTVDEIGPVVGVETQDGQEVLVSDGGEDRRELIRLDEALSTPNRSDPNSGMLVHLRNDVREAAIHCDQVREQQEVVVKPFEGVLGDVPGLSGASVLGDGDVVTILDVETL